MRADLPGGRPRRGERVRYGWHGESMRPGVLTIKLMDQNLYNNITYMYPNATIWLVGHSVGISHRTQIQQLIPSSEALSRLSSGYRSVLRW